VDLSKAGVWLYLPKTLKLMGRGHRKWIVFGPRAQAVLDPYLSRDPAAACFSPREAIADLRAEQSAARRARGGGSGGNRKPPVKKPRRVIRAHYTPETLAQAVETAVKKLNRDRAVAGGDPVRNWTPYQIRHLIASESGDLNRAQELNTAVKIAQERG
jgi:hypothetical protein